MMLSFLPLVGRLTIATFLYRMASLPSFDENCSESEGMTPPFLYGTHFRYSYNSIVILRRNHFLFWGLLPFTFVVVQCMDLTYNILYP